MDPYLKILVLVLAAIFEIIDLIKDWKDSKYPIAIKYGGIILRSAVIICLAIFVITEYKESKTKDLIDAKHGQFGAQKDAMHPFPFMILGGMGSFGNIHVLTFMDNRIDPINIATKDQQIQLVAYIRDSKGDVYATLHERTWEITNPNNIEYNNDDSALEITTGGRVVFQIFLKVDTVFVNGMICDESGNGIFCYNKMTETFGKLTGTQRFILPFDVDIKPIFKYPRFEYLGIRNDKD